MSNIPAKLAEFVRQRANHRCEYCGLSQTGQEATFHVDHVLPRASEGPTTAENLALACVSCSLRKGACQSVSDVDSGVEVYLFHPRRQNWADHFRWNGEWIEPLTPTGRVTIVRLAMNRPLAMSIRQEEALRGRHPPS